MSGAGEFYFAMAVLAVVGVAGRLGVDVSILKLASTKEYEGKSVCLNYFFKRIEAALFIVALFFSALLCVIFDFLLAGRLLVIFIVAMPAVIVSHVAGEVLKGIGQYNLANVLQVLLLPIFVIIAVFIFDLKDLTRLALVYVFATYLVALVSIFAVNSALQPSPMDEPLVGPSVFGFIVASFPFLISSLIQSGSGYVDLLVIGFVSTNEQIGLYGAASKFSVLVNLLPVTIAGFLSPEIARYSIRNELKEMGFLVRKWARISVAMSLVPALPLIFFPEFFLGFFGDSFVRATDIVRILMIGYVLALSLGYVYPVLAMTDDRIFLARLMLLGFVINVFLCVIMSSIFGGVGAALSMVSCAVGMKLVGVFRIRKKLGFWSVV